MGMSLQNPTGRNKKTVFQNFHFERLFAADAIKIRRRHNYILIYFAPMVASAVVASTRFGCGTAL